MLWAALILNLATITLALRKRLILYALINLIFLYLVLGQGFQIANDLNHSPSTLYLFNYINEEGFHLALRYVLGCSLVSFLISAVARGVGTSYAEVESSVRFEPTPLFYLGLLFFLVSLSFVLIFVVIGLDTFLHSSRPGMQSGATLLIVLLVLGIIPLLMKIISRSRINRGDQICALIASVVTMGFSRIHIFFYLTALLLVVYYSAGWYRRTLSFGMVVRFSLIGCAGCAVFFGIGSLHDAQNFTHGSISDLIGFIAQHPEHSLLSVDYNYRVGIEGMSGIAGAFTQSVSAPSSMNPDYGVSVLLGALIDASPSFIKPLLAELNPLIERWNWYPFSIVATGAETFYVSFGWIAVVLYPLSTYLLGWSLPRRLTETTQSLLGKLTAYVFLALGIFFTRGPLAVWIAFSMIYPAIIVMFWPILRRYVRPA